MIEFNKVWKKFKKGEQIISLRDAIPNFFRKAIGNGLEKQEFWALQDVSFKVKKGEVVGIIGSNGAGKSTILKLLAGIMKPNRGDLKVTGRLSALIEVTAGFHPELTGRENTYLNGTIMGMTKKEIDSKFERILEFSGVREFIDTPVKRYSSGMCSRLGFSVAAHMDPDILLVDEVLSVGDIGFQAKCAQKMRELLQSGTTIILVSHNLTLIESLSKRVILIDKGFVLKEGAPDEVIPFYQDIMHKIQEEDFKQEKTSTEYKVSLKPDTLVNITDVTLCDSGYNQKENFRFGEPISIKVIYETKEMISNPIFHLKIIRSDNVLCCSSSSKDNGINMERINGRGLININLGNINLAPGIYKAEITIWDKEVLHLLGFEKENIFRIHSDEINNMNVVFLPKVDWQIK
jgi:lipopolysaccharide transport system ATP-binding protein